MFWHLGYTYECQEKKRTGQIHNCSILGAVISKCHIKQVSIFFAHACFLDNNSISFCSPCHVTHCHSFRPIFIFSSNCPAHDGVVYVYTLIGIYTIFKADDNGVIILYSYYPTNVFIFIHRSTALQIDILIKALLLLLLVFIFHIPFLGMFVLLSSECEHSVFAAIMRRPANFTTCSLIFPQT